MAVPVDDNMGYAAEVISGMKMLDGRDFMETFDPENIEELCPELSDYLEERPGFGTCIRHPLVYSMLHAPFMNRDVNYRLHMKRLALAKAERERQWATYIYLHERPWRLWAFAQIWRNLGPIQYWRALGGLWVDAENIWQNRDDWHAALHLDLVVRDGRAVNYQVYRWAMMDKDERHLLKLRTRTPVMVYRGYCYPGGEEGLSWTLDRSKAEWFARRYHGGEEDDQIPPTVASGIVDREHIIAYFDGRNESEVVVLPEDIHMIATTEVRYGKT